MIAPIQALLAMVVGLAVTGPDPPLAWSPDGEWVAFLVVAPPAERSLAAFPLFPDQGAGRLESGAEASGDPSSATIHRIWAVRVEDGMAVLVAEGAEPMTSPAWDPEGRALAFGRVVEAEGAGDGPKGWEVVVAFGGARDVVARRELDPSTGPAGLVVGDSVAWEPGGTLLAVPDPERTAIELIDPEDGRVRRRIDGARLASFSPIGGRFAFYRARGDRWELVEARSDAGPEADRPIDLVDRIAQAPCWTSDGQAILYLKQGPPNPEGVRTRLLCDRLDGEGPREVKEIEDATLPGETIAGSYLTVGPDGLRQYYAVQFSARTSALSYHEGSHILDRIHPFSGLGLLGAPALSPDGERIAVRFGGPGPLAMPGLIDATSRRMTPLAPDLDAKAAWIAALSEAADPPPSDRERPTRLPFAIEFEEPGRPPSAYRRLAELGGRLVEELAGDRGVGPLTARPGLFFSYLQGDYEAAARAVGEVMAEAGTPDHALRLLGLRAQISLARGRDGEAGEIIEYVRGQQDARVARVEEDGGGGFAVSREATAALPWPEAFWELYRDRLGAPDGARPAEAPPEPEEPASPFEGFDPPPTIAPPSAIAPIRAPTVNGS